MCAHSQNITAPSSSSTAVGTPGPHHYVHPGLSRSGKDAMGPRWGGVGASACAEAWEQGQISSVCSSCAENSGKGAGSTPRITAEGLSYTNLTGIPSYPIPSQTIPSHPTLSHPIPNHPIPPHLCFLLPSF